MNLAFVGYEELSRLRRVLSTEAFQLIRICWEGLLGDEFQIKQELPKGDFHWAAKE